MIKINSKNKHKKAVRVKKEKKKKEISIERNVVCPVCGFKTHRLLLGGKNAICINIKCNVSKFTVQDFDPSIVINIPKVVRVQTRGKDSVELNRGKSFNNSR